MMLRQFAVTLAVLAALEFAVFEWRFHDIVYLSQPAAALTHDAGQEFLSQARHALARPTLTRATLETIAQVAETRHDRDVLIPALARLSNEYPTEAKTHLRLAEALRASGRFDEAEQAYRKAIAATAVEGR